MDDQLNELSKGDKVSGSRGRYNLRFEKRTEALDIPEQSTRAENPDNKVVDSHRGKKAQPLSPIVHNHVPEIREIPKPTYSFNFEHEIQNIRIPVPLTELIKHEEFKKCFVGSQFIFLIALKKSCLHLLSYKRQNNVAFRN
jgi:hypothetical protein